MRAGEDASERVANNNRTTVQLTSLQLGEAGDSERDLPQREERARNAIRLKRELPDSTKEVKKIFLQIRGCNNFKKRQKRQKCQVEFQQEAPPEPLPLSDTPPPSSTHSHTNIELPRLVCDVLPSSAQPREPCPQCLTQTPASPANLFPLFSVIQQTSCITVTLLLLVHTFIPPSA